MRRVLVTGATGFVGSHLVRRLAQSCEVVALVRRRDGVQRLDRSVRTVSGDLTGTGWLRRLPNDLHAVVHLAAMTGVDKAEAAPGDAMAVNCLGTAHLLEFAKRAGVGRFIYCSTGSVYQPQDHPLTEAARVQPPTMYGFTKWLGEQVADRYAGALTVVTLRLFHPYGPGQAEHRLIPRLISSIRDGRPVTLHPGGRPVLSFIYVEDLVEVLVRSLDLPEPAVLNVAGPQAASIREVCEMIGAILHVLPRYQFDRQEIQNEVADTARLCSVLGFSPGIALAEGLARCLT